jgi:hypothetical protein
VIDEAKARTAVFRRSGFAFAVPMAGKTWGIDYDIQLQGRRAIVASNGAGIYLIRGRQRSSMKPVVANGEQHDNYDLIHVADPDALRVPPTLPGSSGRGGIFTHVGEPKGTDDCCFGRAGIYVSFDNDKAEATKAHGDRPFLDGWLEVEQPAEEELILRASSSLYRWERKIIFEGEHRGERVGPLLVAPEIEVAAGGRIHLLLDASAGKMGSRFYLRVSKDGAITQARRVFGQSPLGDAPTPRHQSRRLSLDERQRPVVMWALPKRAKVYRLSR